MIAYCLDVDSNVMDYMENLNATYSNCTLGTGTHVPLPAKSTIIHNQWVPISVHNFDSTAIKQVRW